MKYTLVAVLTFATFTVFGQSTNTTSAAVAYQDASSSLAYQKFDDAVKSYKEAKDLIDKAISEITAETKEKVESKAWFYKAKIYADYANALAMKAQMDKDTSIVAEVMTEKYQNETQEAFKKALTFDRYRGELEDYVKGQAGMATTIATQMYNQGSDEALLAAQQAFFGAGKMMEMIGVKDTSSFLNAAICAEKIQRYDLAVESYKILSAEGFRGGSSYSYLANAYNNLGEDEKRKAAIDEGLAKYPNNKELIIESVNYNLSKGNKTEALSALEKAIELAPDNKTIYFAAGSTLQDLMDADDSKLDAATREEFLMKAGGYYDKALELDPNYADAAYNKGAMYLNAGIDTDTEKNNLDLNDRENFQRLEKKANEMFNKSIEALEVAHKLDSKNASIVKYLKILYGKVGNREKQVEMNNKLKELE
ncbi:MAG: tetratricopeptide repeat protein [Crocinitomicaceae bacterium]|nr:tetratricopeptide repeat protein [Crocinitomicaceae bacterium]